MYIKPEFLRRQMSIDLDDTEKFDNLPEKGLSAGLVLKIDCPTVSGQHYAYATVKDKYRLVDWITAVQVVTDGKRPLKDMGGAELQASEYWNTGKVPGDQIADRTLWGDHCLIPISWGRFIGDTEYYLNWGDYESIELDITNEFDGTLQDAATIDIINMKIVDGIGLPPSKGIFQERIWRTYATVQDEKKYFKIPAGSPLRRIMLRNIPDVESSSPYRRSDNFMDLTEEIKLLFGDGGEVALDTFAVEQMELNSMMNYGLVHTQGLGLAFVSEDGIVRTGVGRALGKQVSYANVATTQPAYDFSFFTYMDDLQQIWATTGVSNQYVHWDIWGHGYNNTIIIQFDKPNLESMLDTVAKAPIQLELDCQDASAAEDGTVQIILNELVSR